MKVLRILLLLSVPAMGWGSVLSFGSDLLNESNNASGANVVINPHPAWASPAPYSWVSYADTGSPRTVSPPNATIPGVPTAIFREILPAFTGAVRVTVFADDTAAVYLFDTANPSGLLLKPANPFQDGACAKGPIGCQPGEGWFSPWIPVNASGPAWLEIHAYQRGGGPFGVLYGGEVEQELVPEPRTYLLMAVGLAGLYLLRRKAA